MSTTTATKQTCAFSSASIPLSQIYGFASLVEGIDPSEPETMFAPFPAHDQLRNPRRSFDDTSRSIILEIADTGEISTPPIVGQFDDLGPGVYHVLDGGTRLIGIAAHLAKFPPSERPPLDEMTIEVFLIAPTSLEAARSLMSSWNTERSNLSDADRCRHQAWQLDQGMTPRDIVISAGLNPTARRLGSVKHEARVAEFPPLLEAMNVGELPLAAATAIAKNAQNPAEAEAKLAAWRKEVAANLSAGKPVRDAQSAANRAAKPVDEVAGEGLWTIRKGRVHVRSIALQGALNEEISGLRSIWAGQVDVLSKHGFLQPDQIADMLGEELGIPGAQRGSLQDGLTNALMQGILMGAAYIGGAAKLSDIEEDPMKYAYWPIAGLIRSNHRAAEPINDRELFEQVGNPLLEEPKVGNPSFTAKGPTKEDKTKAKLALLAEEIKHSRGVLAPLDKSLDRMGKQVAALGVKIVKAGGADDATAEEKQLSKDFKKLNTQFGNQLAPAKAQLEAAAAAAKGKPADQAAGTATRRVQKQAYNAYLKIYGIYEKMAEIAGTGVSDGLLAAPLDAEPEEATSVE